MTIKFDATAANQYLSMVDSAGLTFPATDFCLSWVMSFDSQTPVQTQYLISNGPYQTAGSINVGHLTGGANFMVVYGQSDLGTSSTAYSTGIRLFVLQRTVVGGVSQMTMRSSPILASSPSTAASVVVDMAPFNFGGTTFDGSGGIVIGGRSDLNAQRFCNQSLGRVFRYDGQLTDLEVAKLAYGMEITDLGHTPAWYVKMDTVSDITDRGTLANTVTPHGSIVTGTSPGFGYSGATSAPAITSVPVIVGGASVGSASSVTPGTTTGNPTPTNTFQWNINGVAVSGQTGTTYTPVSGDVGKTLTVTQTASNGVGSPATATSAGVVVAAATSTVDVTQITAERGYQQLSGVATVPFSGTYTGPTAPTSIEYQLYAADGTTILVPWTAIAGATISGGNWAGSPAIARGGMYRQSVRSKNGTTVLATSNIKANLFGVGDIVVVIGSSSGNRLFQAESGTNFVPNQNVRQYRAGAWGLMTSNGCATPMANYLNQLAGYPIFMVSCGVEGSTLQQWLNVSQQSAWPFTDFTNTVNTIGGKIAALVSPLGSNDAALNLVTSRESHLANLRQLRTNITTITGQASTPFLLWGGNRRPAIDNTLADYVHMAENDLGDDLNVVHLQILDVEIYVDKVHPSVTGFIQAGARGQWQLGQFLYNATYKRGPKITSFAYGGNVITATLQHRNGTDFIPASAINGFTVTDSDPSGVAPTITSVARISATKIAITCNRTLVAPVVKYLAGSAPVSAVEAAPTNEVFDNGAVSLPMTVETVMTASQLATRAVFTVVADSIGTSVPDTANLDYAFYDSDRISAGQAPVKSGTNLAIIGGAVTLDLTGLTSLPIGGIGRIIYGPADGSKLAGGKVSVS